MGAFPKNVFRGPRDSLLMAATLCITFSVLEPWKLEYKGRRKLHPQEEACPMLHQLPHQHRHRSVLVS